ncbi:MAG: tRNA (guanine(10)-N(2))-dimethyltransferase [Crenarchaeota archaeon]|nr:tRNA (guanine(10)-N(2))-dimethyltransferase [Thermoproteota archaeon]
MELPYPTRIVREGLAEIIIPDPDAYRRSDGVYEPAWAPVFYNPRMAFNRDIAVLVARLLARRHGRLRVVEPLTGSGVRAVRYALEAGAEAYAADIDPEAVRLARLNAERNGVSDRVHVECSEARLFMEKLSSKISPELIDIDPFGSPAPFLEAAIHLTHGRGVIAATATDLAPLTGGRPKPLRRRYMVEAAQTSWGKEMALRILAGFIARRAAVHDYAAKPLLAYYADHYIRVYMRMERGARRADKVLEECIAYAATCPKCSYTEYRRDLLAGQRCPYCGAPLRLVGPLYTCRLADTEAVEELLREAEKANWLAEQERAVKLLKLLLEEYSVSNKPYYRLDRLCSFLRVNMPKIDRLVAELRLLGYKASRTHLDPRAIRTNAPHSVLLSVIPAISSTSS